MQDETHLHALADNGCGVDGLHSCKGLAESLPAAETGGGRQAIAARRVGRRAHERVKHGAVQASEILILAGIHAPFT